MGRVEKIKQVTPNHYKDHDLRGRCCESDNVFLVMHQSFETPGPPTSGLSGAFTFYASESK